MFLIDVVDTHWSHCLDDEERPTVARWLHALAPLAFGALALIPRRVWAYQLDILSGVAMVTGLLFAALVFLIQLRHQVRLGDAKAARTDRDKANVDNAFYSTAYAILLGIVLIPLIVVQGLLTRWGWARLPSNWMIYALFAHLLLTMWICVRRLWRMYDVFGLNKP